MKASLTFITTCRGRLSHLKQSLPRLAAQPGATCIVVDYDCPERCGDWVEATFPQVKVVRSGPREHFEAARARNLGAREADTGWLAFFDADAMAAPGLSQAMLGMATPGEYYLPEGRHGSLLGQCICSRADFDRVGGYDDVMQGWGMEDQDLIGRLDLAGVRQHLFPGDLIEVIEHEAATRVAHYKIKERKLSSVINLVYCRAKWDMIKLGFSMLEEQKRADLYTKISSELMQAQDRGLPARIVIRHHTMNHWSGSEVTSGLVYEVKRSPQ